MPLVVCLMRCCSVSSVGVKVADFKILSSLYPHLNSTVAYRLKVCAVTECNYIYVCVDMHMYVHTDIRLCVYVWPVYVRVRVWDVCVCVRELEVIKHSQE